MKLERTRNAKGGKTRNWVSGEKVFFPFFLEPSEALPKDRRTGRVLPTKMLFDRR